MPKIKQYIKVFFENEKSAFPFVILVTITALLFYNNSLIVSAQKKAYESYRIANELRNSAEDLTKYVRAFVATGDPRYEEAYWQVLNIRNGKTVRPDGRKIPLNLLMKHLGFTNDELEILDESQANSDKLVKKEVIAMNAIKGIYDVNISKLIKPNESKRDFAIRVINDESYNHDKANIMNPINSVIQLVDKRTQIELIRYDVLNLVFIFISFFVVLILFIRFIFLINSIKLYLEREKVIRKIIEIMRSAIDINSVKSQVVREIGIYLKADRAFFADYDSVNLDFYISGDSEYKSSEKVKSYVGNEMAINQGIVGAVKVFPLVGKDLIFSDLDKYIEENHINEPEIETSLRDMGCIAIMGMHINYGEYFYGDIVVTFEKKRKIKEEDINFVKTLADQAGIAIYQSELYEKEKEMTKRENLLRQIFETVRSSLDLNIVKNTIVNEVGKALNADRCFLWGYDKSTDGFMVDQSSEYRSSDDVKSLIGINSNDQKIEWLTDFYKLGNKVLFNNVKQFIKENNLEGTSTEQYFQKYNVKANYSIPIFKSDELLGALIVQYTKDYEVLSQKNIGFLRIVAVQAGEAMYNARLYQKVQFQAEREIILRKTIETIRGTIEIDSVKHEMVEQIGKFLNADRVAFADYDFEKENYFIREGNEYRSSGKVKTFVGYNFAAAPGFIEAIRKIHLLGKDIIFDDLDKYLEENNLKDTGIENFYRDMGFLSSLAINIYYRDIFYGNLVITFEKKRRIIDEDINFIKTLADQSGIAIYQADLYQKEKKSTQREKVIANIISKAISTFDINQIKHMVKDVGVITKADRCYFVEVDLKNMKGKPINYEGEYLASSDIKSIIGYDFPTEDVKKFIEIFLEAKDLSVFDYEEILKYESEQYAGSKRYASLFELKSSIGIPFYYMNNLTAVLVIEYSKVKTIPSADELDFLRILGNQVGLAFSQIQNYKNTLKIAEYEKTLRKIMMDAVNIFDTTEVIKLMIIETGKLFKADRCFFAKYDIENGTVFPAPEYSEYLSTKDIESLFSKPITKEETDAFIAELKQREIVIVEDVNKIDLPEITIKMLKEKFSIKSYLILPVYYKNTVYGALVLHYVQDFRQFTQDEIDVAMAIANQSAIVLHQTELHLTS